MRYPRIASAINLSTAYLKSAGEKVDTGHWQGVETEGKPDLVTREVTNITWSAPIPETPKLLAFECSPNLPWAEAHFQERVSREPSNPGEEYMNWPHWRGQVRETDIHDPVDPTVRDFKFTHTYQERFWPKRANGGTYVEHLDVGDPGEEGYIDREGIRYAYGDLDDVVNLLFKHPHTRQATFPIFFPEDTGAVHGGRIPCSLHYHFLLRNNKLHLWYPIRSCDAVRHFRDDIYLAGRLCQWVIAELEGREYETAVHQQHRPTLWDKVVPGDLHFTAYSFHVHMGDIHKL